MAYLAIVEARAALNHRTAQTMCAYTVRVLARLAGYFGHPGRGVRAARRRVVVMVVGQGAATGRPSNDADGSDSQKGKS